MTTQTYVRSCFSKTFHQIIRSISSWVVPGLLALSLVGCATQVTPAQRSQIRRLGVTMGLGNSEITAVKVGITVFGNRNALGSSSQWGLPAAVDRAVGESLSRYQLVPLSPELSQAVGVRITAISSPFLGIGEAEKMGKVGGEAARAAGVDALLIVKPAPIFVHENVPQGRGYMIHKHIGGSYVCARFSLLLCDASGRLLARCEGNEHQILRPDPGWESIASFANPEIRAALLACAEKAVSKGIQQAGLK